MTDTSQQIPSAGAPARSGPEPDVLLDFSEGINPLGPPEAVVEVLSRGLDGVIHYPDPHSAPLREAIASRHQVDSGQVLVGNGACELIYLIPRAMQAKRTLAIAPCSSHYWKASEVAGADVSGLMTSPENAFKPDFDSVRDRLYGINPITLGSPNDPTGAVLDRQELVELIGEYPRTAFVVDETLIEFLADHADRTLLTADMPRNLIVIRSFGRFYAVPGLRLGYLGAHPEMARFLARHMVPWNVNCIAAAAGMRMYDDPSYGDRTRALIEEERAFLVQSLAAIRGLQPYRSATNFILVQLNKAGINSTQLRSWLRERNILIRDGAAYRGLDGRFVGMAVRRHEDNVRLVAALQAILQ